MPQEGGVQTSFMRCCATLRRSAISPAVLVPVLLVGEGGCGASTRYCGGPSRVPYQGLYSTEGCAGPDCHGDGTTPGNVSGGPPAPPKG